MNTDMQQKMEAALRDHIKTALDDDDQLRTIVTVHEGFRQGFTACHDLLMPLLLEAMPHVWTSHGAEHMLDGFRPQRRPIDDLVERLKEATA